MRYRVILTCFFIILFQAIAVKGQLIRYGLPGMRNFPRSEYNCGTQNWAVAQAPNGMVYFANNDGLLEFDGQHWTTFRDVPLVYRSLCIDNKRIYIGTYNEIGYYEPDNSGSLKYHSLTHLIKSKTSDIDEVWRIHKTSFGIVFQSFKGIFIYDKNTIQTVLPHSKFHFSYYVNGILWIYDEVEGLMQYREGKLKRIPDGNFFAGTEIWTILPVNDEQVIVGTAKKGLFLYDGVKMKPWNTPVNPLLKEYQIFSGTLIQDKYYAFGTIQNGLIISDKEGKIVLEMNKVKGLQNNTVLSMCTDQDGSIWLGLDNGISVIDFNSPVTFIQNYFDLGTGYASVRYDDRFYLGTNQGLFYINWTDFLNPLKKKESFKMMEGTEGQVWNLSIIDNTLLCAHNNGAFQIHGGKMTKISPKEGVWTFLKLNQSTMLAGTYNGLSVYVKEGNLWKYKNNIQGFNEASRYMQVDKDGFIWISHWYKGVFRLKLNASMTKTDEVKLYTSKDGLPSNNSINLYQLKNDIVFTTDSGIYKFNGKRNKFEVDSRYSSFFTGKQRVDALYQDQGDNIWYYSNQHAGVFRSEEDGTYKNIASPFSTLTSRIISFEHINALDLKNVVIGIEGGFAHYNADYFKDYLKTFPIHITDLHSTDATKGSFRINSSDNKQSVIPEFSFRNNTISISYAASFFEDQQIYFQYKLNGFDDSWSEWTRMSYKEYTNLHEGTYTFSVKARNIFGTISPELNYKFEVLPPWYRSTLAWIFYAILLITGVIAGVRFFEKSLDKTKLKEKERQKEKFKEREYLLKEESLIAEKEMALLRNEKLNAEMIHKEKELANSTMYIIQKNNILNKIITDLKNLSGITEDEHLKSKINSSIKRIHKEIDNERQWQVFDTYVEQVHEELFLKLKEKYTELSPRELKLCAYLRMNISSKEIATLMNISTRGVEISRYRIRKKLGLDRNANLTEFMLTM
jgi:DNA-binding CsgD family transcriptional regulator/ligand-binding sensor domain-containing protein